MNQTDKSLVKLVDYVDYLLSGKYRIYNRLNKGHIKKLDKLLKKFCREYTRKEWDWK